MFLVFLSLFILFSFFSSSSTMHFLFLWSAMASLFSFYLWRTYLYFLTYSVTNNLHVTVFSSQNFFLLNTLKLTFMNHAHSQKSFWLFFNLFSVLYHGCRSVTVHSSRAKVISFFSELFFCIFILVFSLGLLSFSNFLRSIFFFFWEVSQLMLLSQSTLSSHSCFNSLGLYFLG
jgi:hypothetical protein